MPDVNRSGGTDPEVLLRERAPGRRMIDVLTLPTTLGRIGRASLPDPETDPSDHSCRSMVAEEVWNSAVAAFRDDDLPMASRLAIHYDSLCEETDAEFEHNMV